MSCCGQALSTPPSTWHGVKVRYLGGRSIQMIGPATGAKYEFSGLSRVQIVEPRDALALVRHLQFRFEGLVRSSNANEESRNGPTPRHGAAGNSG